MDIEKAIFDRRSVRVFTEAAVEMDKLSRICEAAVWAPTAGNSQPWLFIPVTDPQIIRLIRTVSPGLRGNPKALIAVLSDKEGNIKRMGPTGATLAEMDCCFAAQNIQLMAHALGLGSCVIRSFNQSAVREILGAPAGVTPELLIILGYAAKPGIAPKRRMEVIQWERYGGKNNG
jgi:nitroreductase